MKLLLGIFLISFIALSCKQKGVSLNEEKLIGLSFEEKVELPNINYSQTSIISFDNGNLYSRTGIMYIKQTGRYFVENDILEIHYACGEHCNRNSTCGVQQYILGTNGNLHLIYIRESDGNIEDLDDTPFDLELERL